MTVHRLAWLWTLALGPAGALHADTVLLNNGDRLSGQIQELEGKHLSLKTAYAGIVKIDWTMVEGISSDHTLQLSMQNGVILTGTVENSAEGMHVSSASRNLPILPHDVKAIANPERNLRNRFNGSIELGYSLTRGNSPLNQSSVTANVEYHTERVRVQTDLSSLFSKQAPAQSTSTHSASTRVDLHLTSAAFAFTLAGFDRDDRERLNLRSTLGGGMGWQIAHSRVAELSLLGGLTFVNENYRGGETEHPDSRGSTGEALAGLSLDKLQLGRLRFTGKASVFPNVREKGRVRVVASSGVRMPVAAHLIWSLRLFERFDSRPVLAVKKHDYGLISSFGFAF